MGKNDQIGLIISMVLIVVGVGIAFVDDITISEISFIPLSLGLSLLAIFSLRYSA